MMIHTRALDFPLTPSIRERVESRIKSAGRPDGGRAIVVTPRPGHLAEIAGLAGMLRIEEGKEERLAETMGGHFVLAAQQSLDLHLKLDETGAADLAFMGPAGHHADRQQLLDSLKGTGTVETTAKFSLTVFTTPPDPS